MAIRPLGAPSIPMIGAVPTGPASAPAPKQQSRGNLFGAIGSWFGKASPFRTRYKDAGSYPGEKDLIAAQALESQVAAIPGLEADDVAGIMENYNAEKKLWDLAGDKSAPQPNIATFARQAREDKLAKTAGGGADPLSMQLLYSQTVAPYLDSIRQQQLDTANQFEQHNRQQGYENIPPAFRAVMEANNRNQVANMRNVATASAGATAAQPSVDAIFEQLQQANQLRQQQIAAIQQGLINGSSGGGNPYFSQP